MTAVTLPKLHVEVVTSLFLSLAHPGTDLWKNKDESRNFPQDYDPEMIKEEKRKELELEIRQQVEPP